MNSHNARKEIYFWLHSKAWESFSSPERPMTSSGELHGKAYDEYVVEQILEISGIADILRQMEKRWRQVLLATFVGLVFPLYVIILFILHRIGG